MRVLVYGAGAVGGYLGGRLAGAGHEVVLICRATAAQMINLHGMSIQEDGETVTSKPFATNSMPLAFGEGDVVYDLIMLGMKSYDLAESLKELALFCPTPKLLMTLQNGIGVEEKVRDLFPQTAVIAGSLTTPVSMTTPNRLVVERSDRGMALAASAQGQDVQTWVDLLNGVGVKTQLVENYQAMKWSKALLNIMGNATAAILDQHPGDIYAYRPTFEVEMDMLAETLAVMRSLNLPIIDLPGSPARQLAFAVRWLPRFLSQSIFTQQVRKGRGDKMPSFHVDLSRGKSKSEVIFHNGAVSTWGRLQNIPTPVNTGLNRILQQITSGEIGRDSYVGKPDQLVAELYRS